MQQRVRGPWEATPAGQAMSLAMARIRLLVADAYRFGQRRRGDPNRQTAQDLVRDAIADLELALRSIADAARCEDTRAVSMLFAGSIRSARLSAPPAESPERSWSLYGRDPPHGRKHRMDNHGWGHS